MSVGIVGAGRVGASIGASLRLAGHLVVGASGVSEASVTRIDTMLPGVPRIDVEEVVRRSDIVFLAVPDDAIAELVDGLAAVGA
ncbi:MAG TPA: NAD(P)-binding domain-containing protein, partial [Demequina sp.]|nr:NAD(P)-binding domain-containing protein [Demequina sp.]